MGSRCRRNNGSSKRFPIRSVTKYPLLFLRQLSNAYGGSLIAKLPAGLAAGSIVARGENKPRSIAKALVPRRFHRTVTNDVLARRVVVAECDVAFSSFR